ncbi:MULTISPECIES: hypothetical protein [Rhizobium]|uniref:hypothetical protein n=1 Tax=Rhizobium TaxID=379 RepID=UPI001A91D62E|nr:MULTISPECIES: hypothetical protein [Rhizobium]MBY3134455.1 hypothetical protein [Rhizobium laguerreae]MBY3157428.1 hypothetical protein [Rhizobium laguerreae]MBY3170022.1 hypothetical protein [Rhizobium laguerreae]MBY3445988.1 hypothetical protein [Rhizobium laguerreae]MBY5558141.1 hypothetical protein [Rhizobium leguminosarum]
MASPWKLLARLVSPRRQQRPEQSSTDDVKPEVLAIAKPTGIAARNELDAIDGPADGKPVTYDQPEATPADPERSKETAGGLHGTADFEAANSADPALSDDVGTTARDARKALQTGEGPTRKRSRRGKTTETMKAAPTRAPTITSVSDEAISLDAEIRLLREQLARKLQLQNAQLKAMLERFER